MKLKAPAEYKVTNDVYLRLGSGTRPVLFFHWPGWRTGPLSLMELTTVEAKALLKNMSAVVKLAVKNEQAVRRKAKREVKKVQEYDPSWE